MGLVTALNKGDTASVTLMRMPPTLCGLITENKKTRKPNPTNTKLDTPPTGKMAAMLCASNDLFDRIDDRRFTW